MIPKQTIRVVLDTNVVFEGLTKQNGIPGTIIDMWFKGFIKVCVTDAMVYEYMAVLTRKLSSERIGGASIALATLLGVTEHTIVHYRWRPSSFDPGDEFVIDCAMNANAVLVTSNVKDFRLAQRTLGLNVMTPIQLLESLAK